MHSQSISANKNIVTQSTGKSVNQQMSRLDVTKVVLTDTRCKLKYLEEEAKEQNINYLLSTYFKDTTFLLTNKLSHKDLIIKKNIAANSLRCR